MDTFWNKKKTKGKKINNRLIKDRIIRGIRALFEQQQDYYKPRGISS